MHENLFSDFKIDCKNCFGLCCVALFFSSSEGFPHDKIAGKPCVNLQQDFKCCIHKDLRQKGLKGCVAYDCLGAGQKISTGTFAGKSWKFNEELAKQMFEAFVIMRQLQEMQLYLTQAYVVNDSTELLDKISRLLNNLCNLTKLEAIELLGIEIEKWRIKVNELLHKTSEIIRSKYSKKQNGVLKSKKICGRVDLIGRKLMNADLRGQDLRGAMLIAADLSGADLSGADLIGSDLRDADLSDANLSKTLFINQAQINAAKGNERTLLPEFLARPSHWR